jgi:hypothetical protein
LLEILRQVIQLNARRSFATKTFSMKSTAFGIPLNVQHFNQLIKTIQLRSRSRLSQFIVVNSISR